MMALLENRSAPLYNRTTDEITLTHLDIASLKAMLQEHADLAPERLLFLWTLFEGVPKFYRDCYEQGVLNQDRQSLLRRIFFETPRRCGRKRRTGSSRNCAANTTSS